MAPPWPGPPKSGEVIHTAPWTWLLSTEQFDIDSVALLNTAAPSPGPAPGGMTTWPRWIASPEIDTASPGALTNRIWLAELPSTASFEAPGPTIVVASVMSSWPWLSGMVPVTPAAKRTVLAPAAALAASSASRRVQSVKPQTVSSWSAVVFTVNVGPTWAASAS